MTKYTKTDQKQVLGRFHGATSASCRLCDEPGFRSEKEALIHLKKNCEKRKKIMQDLPYTIKQIVLARQIWIKRYF